MSNLISNAKFDSGPVATVTGASGDSNVSFTKGWLYSFTAASGAPDYKRVSVGSADLPFPFSPETAQALQVDLTQHGAFAGTPLAGDLGKITQRIAGGTRNYSGQSLTYGFWAKSDVSGQIGVSVNANFGTGGFPTAQKTLSSTLLNVTTRWQFYFVTFLVTNAASQSYGTNLDDYLELNTWFVAGSSSATEAGGVLNAALQKLYITEVTLDFPPAATSGQSFRNLGGNDPAGIVASVVVDAVTGNDGSASRYGSPAKTLAKAKALAQSGDTIIVLPGTYNENDLLKDGVNWHFQAGAIVTFTAAETGPAYGFFDDRSSGAATSKVSGYGKFNLTFSSGNGNDRAAIVTTNALTDLIIQCSEIIVSGSHGGVLAGLFIANCSRVIADIGLIWEGGSFPGNSCAGVYWEKGECELNIKKIECSQYAVYGADIGGSPDTNLYLTSDSLNASAATTVYMAGDAANPNFRMWINAKLVKNVGGAFGTVGAYNGGKLYLTAQKLESSHTAAVTMQGAAKAWVSVEKVSSTFKWVECLSAFTGELYITCQHYDDPSSTVNPGFNIDGTGKVWIFGGYGKLTAGRGIDQVSTGITRVQGLILDTSNTTTATVTGATNLAATNITAATNASPIVVTSTAHGLTTGDRVVVASVGGNTAANGNWAVTVIDANSFSLNTSTGNGAYTAGGTVTRSIKITTSASHGFTTGDWVGVASVGGNTNANANWFITVVSATAFYLDGSTGNAVYTSGGTAHRLCPPARMIGASGLILDRCTLICSANDNSLIGTVAGKVAKNYGSKANRAVDSTVTVQVDAVTVDANVA